MRRTPANQITPELEEKLVSLGLFKATASKAKDVDEFDTSDEDDDFPIIPTKVLTSGEFKTRVGLCPFKAVEKEKPVKDAKQKCMRI